MTGSPERHLHLKGYCFCYQELRRVCDMAAMSPPSPPRRHLDSPLLKLTSVYPHHHPGITSPWGTAIYNMIPPLVHCPCEFIQPKVVP
eukprot:5283402-Pyramimonas_sp.AAC.1